MRSFLWLAAVISAAAAVDNCYYDVSLGCGPTSKNLELPTCNSLYGAFRQWERFGLDVDYSQVVIKEMQAYTNLHIARSYEFLLASTFFHNYQTNREGFTKLFRKMSDDAWDSAIGLIKHITRRGRAMDFDYDRSRYSQGMHRNSSVELHELGSLAKALDVQKEMAEAAFSIHREATRNRQALHDAEIAHYLEEEFVGKQADIVRKLAGHTSDIKKFIADNRGQDVSMALFIFDSYLSKIV